MDEKKERTDPAPARRETTDNAERVTQETLDSDDKPDLTVWADGESNEDNQDPTLYTVKERHPWDRSSWDETTKVQSSEQEFDYDLLQWKEAMELALQDEMKGVHGKLPEAKASAEHEGALRSDERSPFFS